MSEPRARARWIEPVVPGVLHWGVRDDRIDFRSEAYAVRSGRRVVLIDPLPLAGAALEALPPVEAICLTGSCHQRSSWRYRKLLGAPVWAPAGAQDLEEEPDRTYRRGARLPGGLRAVHAPGPTEVHFAFHLSRGRGVLFCGDVLIEEKGALRFVEGSYQDEPERTRRTARRLLRLEFATLCSAHGEPLTRESRGAILQALARDEALTG